MNICTKMSHIRLNFAYEHKIHYAQNNIIWSKRKYKWYDYK